jgi:hypothetical protein
MFVFMHYNGGEPGWANAIMQSGLLAYSPARPLESQLSNEFEFELESKKPNVTAYQYTEAFKLTDALWKPFSAAKATLLEADHLLSTEHCIWRDQWFLSRADALLVENGASLEIPLLAYLWNIPVVAVSFTPTGMHPWLAKAAQVTVNSPENAEQILAVLNIPEIEGPGLDAEEE